MKTVGIGRYEPVAALGLADTLHRPLPDSVVFNMVSHASETPGDLT